MPEDCFICRRSVCAVFWIALACAVLSSVGCQSWNTQSKADPKASTTASTSKAKPESNAAAAGDPFKALVDDNWVLAISPPGSSEPPRYRWRHTVLDDLLASPRNKQPNWQAATASDLQMVRINAAIALARLGEGEPVEILNATVRGANLKLPVRRAAAEALGAVHTKEAVGSMEELLDQYGKFTGEARSRYVPELHAELLHALSLQPEATSINTRLADALKSPAAPVKREALELLAAMPAAKSKLLPVLALDLTTDSDSQVRISALKVLTARKHAQAEEKLVRGLSDYELNVRMAAIELLGQSSGGEGHARLKKLAGDSAEMVRVAAVQALAKSGDREAVEAAAKDTSWRVRREVAKNLSKYPDRGALNLAKQFLQDASLEVQRETVRMTMAWPNEKAGAVLLAAMESPSYQSRKDAATLLADRWLKAAGFPIDAPAARRSELLAELQTNWTAEFGNLDQAAMAAAATPAKAKFSAEQLSDVSRLLETLADSQRSTAEQAAAIESLVQMGSDLPALLDALVADQNRTVPERVYRDVLPQCAQEFVLLEQFSAGNQTVRRQSLTATAKLAEGKILPGVAISRLEELLATEADPVVWLPVFKLIERDPREAAALIAVAGVNHPSPEIRRRACGYFANYPDPTRAELLLKLLDDSNISLLHAALQALGELPTCDKVAPVERLLAHSDHALRLDAAITLARWNCASGPAALERLAADEDPQLRRKTAQAIGKLGDEKLIGVLVKLLDDQQDIRRAALIALRSLTVNEIPPNTTSAVQPAAFVAPADGAVQDGTMAEQAEAWKQWHRRQK